MRGNRILLIAIIIATTTYFSCGQRLSPVLVAESGFITIEPVNYSLIMNGQMQSLVSDEARIWYAFRPADSDPDNKPLAVFFNGGPGCSTGLLLGFNTGTMSVDKNLIGDSLVGDSPSHWTTFANLLYIDARNTGFSYGIKSGHEPFDVRNFNTVFDAGDFIRVILRFLASHEGIKRNPVIIVGESYGGTRSPIMLNLLHHYSRYAGSSPIYKDEALAAEIQKHLDALYPDKAGTVISPELVSKQFGHQVLIQPFTFGVRQADKIGELLEKPGSPVYAIAQETGQTFVPCSEQQVKCDTWNNALNFIRGKAKREAYKYNEAVDWINKISDWYIVVLLSIKNHTLLTSFDPRNIALMYSTERTNAYKIKSGAGDSDLHHGDILPGKIMLKKHCKKSVQLGALIGAEDEFISAFGALGSEDRYFVDCNDPIYDIYGNRTDETAVFGPGTVIGKMFLEDLLYANTFITNTAYDLVCYAPAIQLAIGTYEEVASVTSANESINLTIKDGAFGQAGERSVTIPFPTYSNSGHPVEANEPVKFMKDVKSWLGINYSGS